MPQHLGSKIYMESWLVHHQYSIQKPVIINTRANCNLLYYITNWFHSHKRSTTSQLPPPNLYISQPAEDVCPNTSIFIPLQSGFSHSNNVARHFDQKFILLRMKILFYTLLHQHYRQTLFSTVYILLKEYDGLDALLSIQTLFKIVSPRA